MFLIKGLNIFINLAYVPLLVNSLNSDKYGIWLTITTIISWISFFDIGLGNGLRNKLAESVAKNDAVSAKQYVSTTYIVLGCICYCLFLFQFIIIPFINWNALFNTTIVDNKELKLLMIWILSTLCIQLLLKLITSVLYGLQKPALASFIITCSQLLAFIGVLLFVRLNYTPTLLNLGIIISIMPTITLLIYSIFLYSTKLKIFAPSFHFFDRSKIKEIIGLGGKFFWIQLTALFLFQSNNFIIAQVCGPSQVTDYNIAYKYIGTINMLFVIITTPFWSAATDAYTRNDYKWIQNIIQKVSYILYGFTLIGAILVIASPFIYKIWLTNSVKPDFLLLSLMLIFFVIQMYWSLYGSIINGIGFIKLQFLITLIEVFVHIPLACILGSYWGIKGIILSLIISSFPNLIWPRIQLRKIFNPETTGIWKK